MNLIRNMCSEIKILKLLLYFPGVQITAILPKCSKAVICCAFQTGGQLAIEVLFPRAALFRLKQSELQRNKVIRCYLRKRKYSGKPWRYRSGSRAEGFALERFWGQKFPDKDTLYIYGQDWEVFVDQHDADKLEPCLLLDPTCPPGFYKIKVMGDHLELARKMGAVMRAELGGAPRCNISADAVRRAFVEENGHCWLSSARSMPALTPRGSGGLSSGPARQAYDGMWDVVPAIPCVGLLPEMREFVEASQYKIWPRPHVVEVISRTPCLLVATGHKSSVDHDRQWRLSFSIVEDLLAKDLPGWAKQGYVAFKYTVMSVLKKLHVRPNNSDFCSYHLKNIFFQEMETPVVWGERCPYLLFLHLLHSLETCLVNRELKHYIVPSCDLFENITDALKDAALDCLNEILSDPIRYIVMSSHPRKIFGGTRSTCYSRQERFLRVVCDMYNDPSLLSTLNQRRVNKFNSMKKRNALYGIKRTEKLAKIF